MFSAIRDEYEALKKIIVKFLSWQNPQTYISEGSLNRNFVKISSVESM
jgi:hypothetical protein